ncbi:hypothetical protein [Domibacillus robiginosus]|uniref:hypothetical protein n=1 Tax=Domibacillus robiginosus TaxID=1071054 RepID=UPI00067BBFF1|nr:hypothetical protein [Domibacillus robiginosus]
MEDTIHTEHTYTFDVNNTELVIIDKSYAGCFRKFWDYFIKYDVNKTVKIIEKAGIRTSESDLFIAKNGSKKKNIPLVEGRWIYTHLNPQAMERVYEKFISAWKEEPEETELETNSDVTGEKPGLKNIYKKSLAMDLIRKGHDLEHTMRNRNNPKYQVFVFIDTPDLRKDICHIQGITYVDEK